MANFIIACIVILIVGGAIAYIVKAKKNGTKCIGCPAGGSCCSKNGESGCNCNCTCGGENE